MSLVVCTVAFRGPPEMSASSPMKIAGADRVDLAALPPDIAGALDDHHELAAPGAFSDQLGACRQVTRSARPAIAASCFLLQCEKSGTFFSSSILASLRSSGDRKHPAWTRTGDRR